jgi:hypothetical protein
MTRKHITTSHSVVACDVCGRTILRGEQAEPFIHSGSRRMVCELCTPRAIHEGWIREGMDEGLTMRRSPRRSRGFLSRLRQRRDEEAGGRSRPAERERGRVGDYEVPYEEYEVEPGYDSEPLPADPVYDVGPDPVPAQVPAPPPAEPSYELPREPRSVRAVPTNAEMKMARALDLFNASEHRRTVSGIARSLGAPIVTVRPSATEGSVVSIVVAWELTWYRYEVDLGNEAAGVRMTSKGDELSELEPEDQVPNAAADAHGDLVLAAQAAEG